MPAGFGYSPFAAQDPIGQALQNIASAMFSKGAGANPEIEASKIAMQRASADYDREKALNVAQETAQQGQLFSSADKSRYHGAVALLMAKGMPEARANSMAYKTLFGADVNANVAMPEAYQEAGGYTGNPTDAQRMQANSENSALAGIAASMLSPATKLGASSGGGNAEQIASSIGKFGEQQFEGDAAVRNFSPTTIATSMLQNGHNPNSNFNNGVSINNLTGVVSNNDNSNQQIKNETTKANSYAAKNFSGVKVDNANISKINTQRDLLANTGNNGGTRVADPNSQTGWSNVLPDGKLLANAVPPYNPSSGGGGSSKEVKPSGIFYKADKPQDIHDAIDTALGTSAIKNGKKTTQPANPLSLEAKNLVTARASQLAIAQGFKGSISQENLFQAIQEINTSNPDIFAYDKVTRNKWLPDDHIQSNHYDESGVGSAMVGALATGVTTSPVKPTAKPKGKPLTAEEYLNSLNGGV